MSKLFGRRGLSISRSRSIQNKFGTWLGDDVDNHMHFRIRWSARSVILTVFLAFSSSLGIGSGRAQAEADWITADSQDDSSLGNPALALQFRREITLGTAPRTFPVKVSADSRFILYVNGHRAGMGPSRGDLGHWRYEVLDLAPYLKPGVNVFAVEVWNDGASAPLAQLPRA